MNRRYCLCEQLIAALLILALTPCARGAEPWRHNLYCGMGGYWRARIPVDVQNLSDAEVKGDLVELAIGKGPGQVDLVGEQAEAVRVCEGMGSELLFDLTDANRAPKREGALAAGDRIAFCASAKPNAASRVWIYCDNPSAFLVPDFLKAGLANGGFESGDDKPAAWRAAGVDQQHHVSWSTERPHSGKRCGKTEVAPGARPTWVKYWQSRIPIRPGGKYRMSGWVRAQGVVGNAGWYVHVNSETKSMLINRTLSAGHGTYDWRKVSCEFTAPPEATHVNIGTLLHGTGVAYFDDISLISLDQAKRTRVTIGAKATLDLTELAAAKGWALDAKLWPCRATIKARSFAPEDRSGVILNADLNRVRLLAKRYHAAGSMRIVDPTASPPRTLPHVETQRGLLFAADLPAHSIKPFHIYFSPKAAAEHATNIAPLVRSPANLVANADFEAGAKGWADSTEGSASKLFVAKTATGGIVGDRCLELQIPANAKLSWSGWRQLGIKVKPNTTYFYAGYIKTKRVADGKVQLYGHCKTADDKLCAQQPYFGAGPALTGDNDWSLCAGTVRTPADCAMVDLHLTMHAHGTVWHDGILFCESADAEAGAFETARAAAPTDRAFDLWVVNPLVKVFQDDPPARPAAELRLAAARNEREPAQLVLRPNKPLAGLDVSVSPIVNAQGRALPAVDVARVGYVAMDQRSSYFSSKAEPWQRKVPNNAGRTDGWAGMWPDPIPPMTKMDAPAGQNVPLWLTVQVPLDAKPGDYRGAVTIRADNAPAATLPIVVTVWDFALPKTSHLRALFDLRRGPYGKVFGGPNPKARLRSWYKLLADHRISPSIIYPRPKLTFDHGQPRFDFSEFDEMASYCFDKLGMNVFYTPGYFYAFGWAYKVRKFGGYDAFTPEYEKAFTDAYRLYMAHLKAKGWYDKVVYYISDEPHYRYDYVVEQMKKMCDLVHKADPNVPIYSSTWRHVPEWDGYLDIWGVGQYGCFPVDEMQRRLDAGERLWITVDGQMATDTPYNACERLLPYYCFKYGMDGYEFWGVSWWTYDPWKYGWHSFNRQSADGKEYRWVRYPSGDGFLTYPGDDIGRDAPVSTIRLEQVREGIEDYEYFWLLRDLAAKAKRRGASTTTADKALDDVRALVEIPNDRGYLSTHIMPDPDAVPRVRKAVAKAILALK